jgi:[acyl-carrier-protein] S-malonyltransferase
MTPAELSAGMPQTALAFRGYNLTNLGKSQALLAHGAYQAIVTRQLTELSRVAADCLKRPVDLVEIVRSGTELSLSGYGESLALIVAMEMAHLEILEQCFGVNYRQAQMSLGYSLGEIVALVAGGVMEAAAAVELPLTLADDCVALADGVTLGVLFTRSLELPVDDVRRICVEVTAQGRGVIGISSILSPNSVLLLGQHDTLDRFIKLAEQAISIRLYLRRNAGRWPPLHTPIIYQRQITDRAALRLQTLPLKMIEPQPDVFSLVTGRFSYNDFNAREMLRNWVDHPQRLWDGIYETLAMGIATVIHVGPEPNLIPATFKRLADNVTQQARQNLGMRAFSAAANRPWLRGLLPNRASLFRAPFVQHVILEDWLLENSPGEH